MGQTTFITIQGPFSESARCASSDGWRRVLRSVLRQALPYDRPCPSRVLEGFRPFLWTSYFPQAHTERYPAETLDPLETWKRRIFWLFPHSHLIPWLYLAPELHQVFRTNSFPKRFEHGDPLRSSNIRVCCSAEIGKRAPKIMVQL